MGPFISIAGLFRRMGENVHMLLVIVPKKTAVVNKAIFSDILSVAADFFITNGIIIYLERKVLDWKGVLIKLC